MSNKQNRENYWFILDNRVHISLKGDAVLCYSPLSGGMLEYTGKAGEAAAKLIKRLQSAKNLGVIRLTGKELSDPMISQFVHDMRGNFMADLMDVSLSKGKPMQMLPYFKVHKDVEIIKKISTRSVGESMMKYLAEISIYINGTCSLGCDMCRSAYKQFLCCTGGGKREINISSLTHLFEQLKGLPQLSVNILGGDIFKYSQWDRLSALLKDQPSSFKKIVYTHYLNLPRQEEKHTLFSTSPSFRVLVTLPVQEPRWQQALETLRRYAGHGMNAQFLFVIADETEFTEAEELIETYGLENYEFRPFYNGCRSFFEENVFIDKDDILEARPTLKEIAARQRVNPLHFGRLTVLNNGHIHANVNVPRLGTQGRNSISDAVYKEMYRGKSWRRIRKKVEPCRHCVFEALCPPLSNYEYALVQSNLCHAALHL